MLSPRPSSRFTPGGLSSVSPCRLFSRIEVAHPLPEEIRAPVPQEILPEIDSVSRKGHETCHSVDFTEPAYNGARLTLQYKLYICQDAEMNQVFAFYLPPFRCVEKLTNDQAGLVRPVAQDPLYSANRAAEKQKKQHPECSGVAYEARQPLLCSPPPPKGAKPSVGYAPT